ncbi:MAG: hypothetical protein ABI661_06970, partial [Gammaproteobacteria bacterium]
MEEAVSAALGMRAGPEDEEAGRVYRISALTGAGTTRLAGDLMTRLEQLAAAALASGEGDAAVDPLTIPTGRGPTGPW